MAPIILDTSRLPLAHLHWPRACDQQEVSAFMEKLTAMAINHSLLSKDATA